MINIDSHSFNNNVAEQIDKIKTALKKITPDNIMYFDDALIRKARGVVNAVDEYKWSSNSSINSIPVKTIKRMTDFMKTSKYEYVVLDDMSTVHTVIPTTFGVGESSFGTLHVEYEVPDGFDGRNSFVKVLTRAKGDPTDIVYNQAEWMSNVAIEGLLTKTILSKNKLKISYNKTQSVYDAGFAYTYFEYVLFVFVWRKK